MIVVQLEVPRGQMMAAITGLGNMDMSFKDMRDIDGQLKNVVLAPVLAGLADESPYGETGELQEGWRTEPSFANYEWRGPIWNEAPHFRFVMEGTGIYGPEGAMIEAQPGRPFVFNWVKGVSRKHFVLKEHKGQPPNQPLWNYINSDALGEDTLRATDRVLRGLVEYHWREMAKPASEPIGGYTGE